MLILSQIKICCHSLSCGSIGSLGDIVIRWIIQTRLFNEKYCTWRTEGKVCEIQIFFFIYAFVWILPLLYMQCTLRVLATSLAECFQQASNITVSLDRINLFIFNLHRLQLTFQAQQIWGLRLCILILLFWHGLIPFKEECMVLLFALSMLCMQFLTCQKPQE